MTTATEEQAHKQLLDNITKASKQIARKGENYMHVRTGWSTTFILPYAAAVQLIAALQEAETLADEHADRPSIVPMDKEGVAFRPFSAKEYRDIKVATLLNVPVRVVREAGKEPA